MVQSSTILIMFLENKTQTEKLMQFESFHRVLAHDSGRKWKKLLLIIIGIILLVLFLPWTQNIHTAGTVSTLRPDQRPQEVNSIIAGRILKWHIRDGQLVKKGDTLLQLGEVKEDYLDENLLMRVNEQIDAKNEALQFYAQKATATSAQEEALKKALQFKKSQLQNKLRQYTLQVESDSMSYQAAQSLLKITTEQLNRQKKLYEAGLKSLTELEQRQQYYQDAQAKKISAENKFYNSKNELLNIKLELLGTEQEYAEKLSKTSGERFTALSQLSSTESEVAKLRNQFANYTERRNFYVITAPQSGQVIRTIKSGIGETVKEGEQLLQIVPTRFEPAVEMYVSPLDMPLIQLGQKVRLQFDGFPAIVFSGWPKASYGTFGGLISAVDPSIHPNGKFRVWVSPDGEKAWPEQIRYGAGTQGIALLNDVPVIYELWRQLNGFPPKYYQADNTTVDSKKSK